MMKAMAKDPAERYGSAEELRADLLRFADGRPVEAGDPSVTSVMTGVGATQAVPATTGRTMAIGAAAPTDRDELERKKRTRRLVILLVVLLVALAIIAFFLLRSVFGGNVSVPDVVGQTVSQATQTLQNDHLTVGTTNTVVSNTVTSGVVMSTDPKADASVAKNSAVDLIVSAGPACQRALGGGPAADAGGHSSSATPASATRSSSCRATSPSGPSWPRIPLPKAKVKSSTKVLSDGVGHADLGLGAERARADRGHGRLHPRGPPVSTSVPRRTGARASTAAGWSPPRPPHRTQRRNPTAPSTS